MWIRSNTTATLRRQLTPNPQLCKLGSVLVPPTRCCFLYRTMMIATVEESESVNDDVHRPNSIVLFREVLLLPPTAASVVIKEEKDVADDSSETWAFTMAERNYVMSSAEQVENSATSADPPWLVHFENDDKQPAGSLSFICPFVTSDTLVTCSRNLIGQRSPNGENFGTTQ